MSEINTSAWKEFKISDLFDIGTTKSTDKNKICFNKNGKYDFIGRSIGDYGVQGKVDYLGYEPNAANTFSIVQIGETCCLFREKPWYASQNIFKLTPKFAELISCQLYIATSINKLLVPYKEAYTYPTLEILKGLKILLPVKETYEPDWEYMEERIKELEEERIKELEAYLITTGLDDYELTEEDKKILSLSTKTRFEEDGYDENFDGIWMKEFKIGDLFEKLPLKNKVNFNKKLDISQIRTKEFNLPLVNAKNGNNGIMYYGRSSDYEHAVMTIGIVNDGAISTGNVNPHPEPTGVLYNAYLIKPICDKLSREILEYLSCCLQKTIKHQFGYDNKASWDKVKKLYILLPTTSDNFPDFDYMEKYIRAIEKLTIKKVYEAIS